MSPFTFVENRIDRFVLPLVSRHALEVLKREYGCTAAHQILWNAWNAFGELAACIPARRPPSTRLTLSLAATWAALHGALLGSGAGEQRATAIVAEVGARSYRGLSRLPWWLARLVTLDTITLLSVANRVSGWIANGSSYARREVSPVNGSVTMDVDRCDPLEPYRDLGIAHLSPSLVCDLELAVADERDAGLTRKHSNGDTRCHLHLRSIPPHHGGHNAEQAIY